MTVPQAGCLHTHCPPRLPSRTPFTCPARLGTGTRGPMDSIGEGMIVWAKLIGPCGIRLSPESSHDSLGFNLSYPTNAAPFISHSPRQSLVSFHQLRVS